jgi:HAD superfamily hydrolase (TIGR01509 family)
MVTGKGEDTIKHYILFDNDGVLVETEKWYYAASKRANKEFFGIDLEFESYMQIMSRGGTAWEEAQRQGIDEGTIAHARAQRNRYYQEYLQHEDIAIQDVQKILKELAQNYRMGIVTTSRRVDFEIIHKGRGIVDFMDFILCEEDYKRAKPHPEPYLTGLGIFNAQKEQAIVVEDSKRGLTSANRAQIECVIVHNEFTKTHDFSTADYRIDRLSDLTALLERLSGNKSPICIHSAPTQKYRESG